jgi:hypothetical protein
VFEEIAFESITRPKPRVAGSVEYIMAWTDAVSREDCIVTMRVGSRRVVSEPSVMRHTDKAASLRLTSLSRIFASSYSEEPGAEILYHGKDRLWIAAVLGWLRRPS